MYVYVCVCVCVCVWFINGLFIYCIPHGLPEFFPFFFGGGNLALRGANQGWLKHWTWRFLQIFSAAQMISRIDRLVH